WNAALPDPKKKAFEDAIKNLDDTVLVTTPPTLEKVRERIKGELDRLDAVLRGVAQPAAAVGAVPAAPKTVEQLTVQVALVSAFMWLFVIVATTLVGTLALVLSNSFGSASDYLTCLLWGLGLPIGGQAVAATMGGVGASLGITITK